jgi:cell wall-associated NlpC family hydrolase
VSTPVRLRLRASAVLLVLLGAFGLVATTTATPANAMTSLTNGVLHEAARHKGKPYSYGASGPTRFDCSGFTMYVFARFGKRLPHNSGRQYAAVRHVSKRAMRVGDLVFFRSSGGRIYHVGIYAGANRMWHAPHAGTRVRLDRIYSSNFVVGRA